MPSKQTRNFPLHSIFGDVDIKKAEALHKEVCRFTDELIQNHAMQNVLMNHGYELEEERPSSYLDLMGGSWNRKKVCLHLSYLDMMLDLVTQPNIVAFKRPAIIANEAEDKLSISSARGFDFDKIESIQREWMKSPETGNLVREYKKALEAAFDEYNLQFVMGMMQYARRSNIPSDWKDEHAVQVRIDKVMDTKAYTALDSAYYMAGNRLFQSAGPLWQKLDQDNFGKFFRLTPEEVTRGLRSR